ncbi:F-box domain-containing protein 7 [Elsinoe australis]|uniref:F-box domain-containing protein 7 n=1 Tax=Elsinoe australis TaxID=40998 RepID=A0A4U7AV34_9PEZI|nr:F-box domain-containing protein 7 [Elsinoe australis]
MFLDELPTETITNIFLFVPSVSSALALSSTCHRFRTIFKSSKRLLILGQAAENQYGPLHDIVQLVTYNSSQPAHLSREAPISDALLKSIVQVGQVAAKWEEVYPFKKWKHDYSFRRLLTPDERWVLRRAIYRLWLFSKAYHNALHPRLMRVSPQATRERSLLLHNYNIGELAEMLDVHNILRDVISNNICPSNGTVRRKFQKRYPGSNYQLLFNIHLNYPPSFNDTFVNSDAYHNHRSSSAVQSKFHNKFVPSRSHEPGGEGWGEDISHYYVVEDMLKLDPGQILHLRDNAPLKGQVEAFVGELGEWFDNNGETFCQTMALVVYQRGREMEEIKEAVEDGVLGVAVEDD